MSESAMVPAPRPAALIPTTFEEAERLCVQLAKSELVPLDFRGKPANVFVAIQLGADLGLSPMQALQSIAVFNGRPTLYGDVGLALAMNSGLLEVFEEWYDDGTQTAHCRAKRKGEQYKEIERTFGAADAQRVRVYDKSSGGLRPLAERETYKSYPKRMYQFRARWWALRDTVPDVFKGVVGKEELEDHDDEPTTQDRGPAPVVTDPAANEFMPRETTEVPEAPVAPVTPDPSVASLEGPDRETVFELHGVRYATAGVTRDQMLDLFKLCSQVDKVKGKDYHKVVLKEFEVSTRSDLTADTAEQYRIRLGEILEARE